MSTMSLDMARENLQAAVSAAEQQRREEARAQIEELSRRGAAIKAKLLPMAARIEEGKKMKLALHYRLREAREQIEIYSRPLAPATFPSDANIADRAEQLVLWQRRQTYLLSENRRAEQMQSELHEALRMNDELISIQYSMRNLEMVSEGLKPGEVRGGTFTVGEDFVSIPSPGPLQAKRLAHE
jgi:hypothetical protein